MRSQRRDCDRALYPRRHHHPHYFTFGDRTVTDTPKLSEDSPETHRPQTMVGASIRALGARSASTMTVRESFAATIMAGLALSGQVRRDEGRAQAAVELADALIAALDASAP